MRTPGSPSARQPWTTFEGMTKASPGPTSKVSPPTVNSKRPDLHEGRLDVRVAVRRADAVGGEGELDEHELGALGEDAAPDVVAGVDGGEGFRGHGGPQWKSDGSQSDSAGT